MTGRRGREEVRLRRLLVIGNSRIFYFTSEIKLGCPVGN